MNLPNFWYGTSLNFDSFRGTNHTVSCFLVPRDSERNLLIHIRTSMRASVRASEISESVHRNFLKFGTKLGLPNATEVTFLDFA